MGKMYWNSASSFKNSSNYIKTTVRIDLWYNQFVDLIAKEGENPNSLEQIGLSKARVGDVEVYSLVVGENDQSRNETLASLGEVFKSKRVAVEVGPGSQIDSLLFAADKVKADVVVGIDTDFPEASQFKHPTKLPNEMPQIILIKGHPWYTAIGKLFRPESESPPSALYSQLVAPDTMAAEAMINMTTPLGKSFMIILDSGAVEQMEHRHYAKGQIERRLMEEDGFEDPSHLDWIKHIFRKIQQTRLSREEYEKGISGGKYPPSQFLRDGDMMVFEQPLTDNQAI